MSHILESMADVAKIVAAVIVGLVLVIGFLLIASSQPTHDELRARQQVIENQLRYISCILLVPPSERVPEVVAACQVNPEDLGDNG